MAKQILGLDLGTNSIGWAVVGTNDKNQPNHIVKAGSRIIPMDAAIMGDFESGNRYSQTGERTRYRGVRRMFERRLLRRERLCRTLSILQALPQHYAKHLNRYGQLNKGVEPQLAWCDGHFLFMDAFNEMCAEFRAVHPELFANGKTIAYDWTIYYLRKKALLHPISKQELAWILMQFNQKRGYNQARGEEEEVKTTEKKEFYSLLVKEVRDTGESSKGKNWYEVVLENGWVYKRQSQYPLDWVGKTKDFIVTTKLNEDGTEKKDKEGHVVRSFRAPDENDWTLRKVKTEQDIENSNKTVGEYIYNALLNNSDQRIIGQLVRTIDRKYYKEELYRIIRKQMTYCPELQSPELYQECINALYPNNDAYRESIAKRGFDYLLVDDILFYQRPLKSKKSLINECPYEYWTYKDKDGIEKRQYLKCVPKSHPLYEEFRVRQFVSNLHLYTLADNGVDKIDCTSQYITDKEFLVEQLLMSKAITEKALLKLLAGKNSKDLSWNYVPEKEYPMAPVTATLSQLLKDNVAQLSEEVLAVWHILYSVSDKTELEKALKHYADKKGLSDEFVDKLKKQKPYATEYGAYSLKATKKLLALLRSGRNWKKEDIDANTLQRIEHVLTGEFDPHITERVREKCTSMQDVQDFQGLELWLAEYVVYGVKDHSTKWATPDDIDNYIQHFRLHSLNNPIVEQVVLETLRTVRDIWKQYGTLDEIHLEMGRDLKNPADKRKQMQKRALENEKTNLRIKYLLQEFMNPDMDIEGARSYSPSQQELLRIYEEGVLSSNAVPEDIQKTIDALSSIKQPTHAEIVKYRLWLDQKYTSPYTGQIIPLAKLFTSAYQIEHVIPQSRYFDDSLSNKVICEAEVNALKDRQLAHEFISQHGGEKVTLTGGKVVTILSTAEYENLIKKTYASNKAKLEKLMSDDIPESFIARQLNDSRYISRLIKGLLSNIVREQDPQTHEYEQEETSKNVIVCSGSVTDRLKKDWGVNDVWNHIILPRFERLNQLQNTSVFTTYNKEGHLIPNLPIELSVNKKRIDHRHHAMDAIVIACTTRNHVNLLSNLSAMPEQQANRMALNNLLRERISFGDGKHLAFDKFLKPWETFTQEVEVALQEIIVSFKQNLRVINKSVNHYTKIEDGKKVIKKQTNGDNWAIRKSLHKETGFGLVNLQMKKTVSLKYALEHLDAIVDKDLRKKLRELLNAGKNEKQIKQYFASEPDVWSDINLQKIEVYYYTNDTAKKQVATRFGNDLVSLFHDYVKKYSETDSSKEKELITIREKVIAIIKMITDKGIQDILKNHLEVNHNDVALAFSPDGIERMNANIQTLTTHHKPHKPIYKVRVSEDLGEKFMISSNNSKYVVTDKDSNLYCGVFQKDGIRVFDILHLRDIIRLQMESKRQQISWQELYKIEKLRDDMNGYDFLFMLSPGDIVYVPTKEESISGRKQYYVVNNYTGNTFYFRPINHASAIHEKEVDLHFSNATGEIAGSFADKTASVDGKMIKDICIPIQVDRLGNIITL